MEYARMAPSSMNRQPWMFIADENHLEIRLEPRGILAPKMQLIDLGIAAAHADIYLGSVLDEVDMKIYEDRVLFNLGEADS